MKKVILIALCLTGCAQGIWVKQTATSQQAQRDFAECEYDAKKFSYVPMYGSGIGAGIEEGMRYNELMNQCMIVKGYHLEFQ